MKFSQGFMVGIWFVIMLLGLITCATILLALDVILDKEIMFIICMFWLSSMGTGVFMMKLVKEIDIQKGRIEIIDKKP